MPLASFAQERAFNLAAPAELVDSGILGHLLPRFTLKHRIRVTIVNPGDTATASIGGGDNGTPVFTGPANTWRYRVNDNANAEFGKFFGDWLLSDVGRKTIESYQPNGTPLFIAYTEEAVIEPETIFEGDALTGESLALLHCGRCHVVNESNRMKAIGSTPSFAVLRTFDDWDVRFQAFYTLNPHPAFTQITDVTEPFPANTPSPIFPLQLTVENLEAILAFVTLIEPADLGAPIRHQ
jgi:hypothetical protein